MRICLPRLLAVLLLGAVSFPCSSTSHINKVGVPQIKTEAALTAEQQLLLAIRKGLLDEVRGLIGSGLVDPNTTFEEGISALHVSVINGQDNIAAVLVQSGANIEAKDNHTEATPLHLTAVYGRTHIAKLLIQKGANVNAKMKMGITPLMVAAQFRQPQIAELLLNNKADPNQTDEEGSTALHITAQNGDEITARLLLKQNVAVNAQDKSQATALSIAKQNNQISMVNLLQEQGAN